MQRGEEHPSARAGQGARDDQSEVVDLCGRLGVPVKSHSSSLNEAYADMVRRRADP